MLVEALRQCDNDRKEVAQRLGLSLSVVQAKIKEFNLGDMA